MKKALLIVDVQNDFCPGGALPVTNGDRVVKPLNTMINHARTNDWLIGVSRDWHPGNHCSFKTQGGLWPPHCIQNTSGAEFHPGLNMGEGILIISKGDDPEKEQYSAFDGHTKSGRSLEKVLQTMKVEELYIGGLATDYCVKATALHAQQKGFKTFLLFDACRAVDVNADDGLHAVLCMSKVGIIITNTKDVINGKVG